MPLEDRTEFCRTTFPVGSEFRGTFRRLIDRSTPRVTVLRPAVVTKLCGNTVWLSMSKNANPKLRLSPALLAPAKPNSPLRDDSRCAFRYLVILDLEATCDYAPEPVVDVKTAEVTEFPWVVLDTRTGEIVHERQMFVRPTKLDAVTYYCTKLTGISQDMVQDGVSLQSAMQIFDEYISQFFGEDRSAFRIVTDGIWDLSIQLYTECARKGLMRPWYFQQYFDLKDCFCRCFPFFPPSFKPSLLTLLNAVGLDVVGQHHRGLDDCKTIAQLVVLMLRLGFPFDNNIKTIPSQGYDPWQHPEFVDFGSRCDPDSWKCTTPDCGIWNRPWMFYCRFCDCRQTDQTVEKAQAAALLLSK